MFAADSSPRFGHFHSDANADRGDNVDNVGGNIFILQRQYSSSLANRLLVFERIWDFKDNFIGVARLEYNVY